MDGKRNFWTTLPGIISATAGLITALAGAVAIWNQVHPRTPPTLLAPRIAHFVANPPEIKKGESAELCWAALNVAHEEVQIDNNIGVQYQEDCISVQPVETTTYTLTATNEVDSTQQPVTVIVNTSQ